MSLAFLRHLVGAAALGVSLLAAPTASAVVVTLAPSSVTPAPGSSVLVDIRVSELGSGVSIGAFDLDIGYNAAFLSFTGATFGSALGNPAAFEALTNVSMGGPGLLDIGEVSLLTPAQLAGRQTASFSLGTLSFTAVTATTSVFTLLSTSSLGDAFGRPLPITQATPIPEPENVVLLAMGLVAVALARRRRGTPGVAAG